jgi:hypothetical protein
LEKVYEMMCYGDAFELQRPEISSAIKELGFRGYLTNETD